MSEALCRFWLNEFELLRAVNEVSRSHGGCRVGYVGHVYWRENVSVGGTYRNQWLISAELVDLARWGNDEAVPQWSIRLGFCQTQIQRAPYGGFAIEVEPQVLSLCRSVDDVVQAVEAHFGKQEDRLCAAQRLWSRLKKEAELIPAPVWAMTAMVRGDALVYANETRTI